VWLGGKVTSSLLSTHSPSPKARRRPPRTAVAPSDARVLWDLVSLHILFLFLTGFYPCLDRLCDKAFLFVDKVLPFDKGRGDRLSDLLVIIA
jgi:hypothetical protein